MRWTLLAASAALAAALSLPCAAAQPATPAAAAPGAADPITFEQYRDWRLTFIERRQEDLARQLSAADLPAQQKARLEQVKAYYDWFAHLPEADRDRRFRERFDRIDANHDGQIDQAERTAWREKQRAFYGRSRNFAQQPTEAAAH
jgi:hypothetical protein